MQGLRETAKAFGLVGMMITTISMAADDCENKIKNFKNAVSEVSKACSITYENDTKGIFKGTGDMDKIRECILSEIEMITLQIGASACLLETEFPPVSGSSDMDHFAYSDDNIEHMKKLSEVLLNKRWNNLVGQLITIRSMSSEACFTYRAGKVSNVTCPEEKKVVPGIPSRA